MKAHTTVWNNIRRSPYQAFAAIFIMLQTFFVVSIFAFMIFASAKTIDHFESIPRVDVFFKNDAKQEDINTLKQKLEKTGEVKKIEFTSHEEAFKIYSDQHKDDPLLLELVTADILPASFSISTFDANDLPNIVEVLKTAPITDKIAFPKDAVDKLLGWTDALRKIGLVMVTFLVVDSIFIIVIIISIKVSRKKEDINIMRLIGASGWYIRWPFILEGITYGVVGAIIGWALSSAVLWYSTPFLTAYFQGIPIFPIPFVLLLGLLLSEILLAIILGAISSFLAVLRYLK